MIVQRRFVCAFVLLVVLLLAGSACSSPPPEAPPKAVTIATEPAESISTVGPSPTAVPIPTAITSANPTATRPLRSYALGAANLLNLVELGQSQALEPEMGVNGRITPNALAIPYTYAAQAGEVLLIELLLPGLADDQMQAIRPAIFIADAAGNELGYMRGGPDFVSFDERRSIAQAGFVAPADGDYTILATLDGHQSPQNPVYEADFTLMVTPATPLAVNEPYETTRASSERHVYSLTTAVGEFDLVYEDLAGTPPGQYLIEVKRLGTPSDSTALHDTLAAGGAVNQTYAHQDNAYATIAEGMGVETLTYFIFVNSFALPDQEQEPYTSNYRLTIVQNESAAAPPAETAVAGSAPTRFTSSIVADETWETHLNHPLRIQFRVPEAWESPYNNSAQFGHNDAFVQFNVADFRYPDIATACQNVMRDYPDDVQGMGELVTTGSQQVCVVTDPQSGQVNTAVIKYPQPIEITGSIGPRGTWDFLLVEIQPADYFWPIVESVTIPNEVSASLFLAGVIDIFQAHYYFESELDWPALEAELYARIDDSSTLDDAYAAIHWLVEEIATTVGHHHMILRTPEQAQAAQRGQSNQVGLQMLEDAVTLVWPGSPAALSGLQVGDRVVTVNGEPFAEANFNADSFDVVVERAGQTIEATLTPQPIPVLIPPRSQRWGNVVYLETFGIDFGTTLPLFQTYATGLHATMNLMSTADTCGWVLDLRRNTGGSIPAILGGIAPLVGDGELYHVRWGDGREEAVYYEAGRVYGNPLSDLPAMVNIPFTLPEPNPPIAVLVSRGTASAGEASAMVVAKRPEAQARIFGEQTQGLMTPVFATNLFDGGVLTAPLQLGLDVEGNAYWDGIIPDEEVAVVYDGRYGTPDDPVVQAALSWLAAEHGCPIP